MRTHHRTAALLGAATIATAGMLPAAAGSTTALVGSSVGMAAAVDHSGRIAFSRKCTDDFSPYELYVMDEGGNAQALNVIGQHPTWSPTGQQLAFYTWQAGVGIFVADADGSNVRLVKDLTGVTGGDDPAWSPDGRRIAFSTSDGVFVMAADGSRERRLARVGSDPAWSPDGRRIVVAAAHLPDTDPGLYVIRAKDGHVRLLTDKATLQENEPAWSPNGREIAFSGAEASSPGDYRSDLYLVSAQGGPAHRLTRDSADAMAADDYEPAWSPDGRRIAFVRGGAALCSLRLYVMKANGGHPWPLSTGELGDQSPAWFGPAPTRTTLDARPEPARKGAALRLAGQVTKVGVVLPNATVKIRFQAHKASRFRLVTTTTTGRRGGYQVRVTAHKGGTWQAEHPATAATRASRATDHVTVHP